MLNKQNCPEFEDDNFEPILKWAKARVYYCDGFVDGKGNKVEGDMSRFNCWGFSWKHGFISFETLSKREDETRARCAAALFLYLWCKGVSAAVFGWICPTGLVWNENETSKIQTKIVARGKRSHRRS